MTQHIKKAPAWPDLIRPSTVNLIIGYKGRGKSALGYWLMETIAPLHGLKQAVVNFPEEKGDLLPPHFIMTDLASALTMEHAFVLVDEGTTQLPAGGRLEDFIKACSSLARQRDQIVIFVFHASRDVGSKILRGIDAILVKEPSRRQITQGSKDKSFTELLVAAKAAIRRKPRPEPWTYIDAEDPDYTGLMENPLPSFWSEGLSKAWSGVALTDDAATSPSIPCQDALRLITEYECWFSMSQYPDGWTAEDVGVVQETLDYLVQQGFLTAKSAGRYTSTSLGRTMGLDLLRGASPLGSPTWRIT